MRGFHALKMNKNTALSGISLSVKRLKAFDAAHLACAEHKADALLTVDHQFIKKAQTIKNLALNVVNPIPWLETLP